MSNKIMNLTFFQVTEELDKILAPDLACVQCRFFNDNQLKEKLTNYVFNKMPNHHISIKEECL